MTDYNRFHVALTALNSYGDIDECLVADLFDAAEITVPSGTKVLVKPNLISPESSIAVTHPRLTASVCRFLLDHGNRVVCADSPAFGSPARVALKTGLSDLLADIGIEVEELNKPVKTRLPCGVQVGISRKALEAEQIINLPKLKAHCQVGITAGVKNMFGAVCGFRKALVHFSYGDVENMFPSIIVEITDRLAPACTIVDAVTAMHENGPVHGTPFKMGMVAASSSPFALDTALYALLGISEKDRRLSLWQEARRRGKKDAFRQNIHYPLAGPEHFDARGFLLPPVLQPESFNPLKLIKGRIRSMLMRAPLK